MAQAAEKDGMKVFKYPRWQLKKVGIPEVLNEYKSLNAELNIVPFCSQLIPMDVIDFPNHESIVYHPSILPRHRGASAIKWLVRGNILLKGFNKFRKSHQRCFIKKLFFKLELEC